MLLFAIGIIPGVFTRLAQQIYIVLLEYFWFILMNRHFVANVLDILKWINNNNNYSKSGKWSNHNHSLELFNKF